VLPAGPYNMLTIVCCIKKILNIVLHTNNSMFMNVNILKNFGNRVRELRKLKSYSQEELGYRAGLHRTYIGMIERGEKNITLLNIQKIAKALDIEIYKLFL
jgi:DNA-binding XRE family transcriptional regulator